MNCRDSQEFVHAYLDGELDLVRHLEMERHLDECPTCAAACERQQALRSALRAEGLRYEAPQGLRRRVRSALRQADPAPRAFPRTFWPRMRVAAALLLVSLGTGVAVRLYSVPAREGSTTQSVPPREGATVREVLFAHVRSLQADLPGHLTDKASSDQHVVKPFFDGKLGYAVWVQNPAEQEFPLVGGRLDYLDDRPVAALVYQRRKHRINLFQWPATGEADSGTRVLRARNYRLYHWTRAGMTYWVVSDLNDAELQTFVELVRANS